MPEENFVHAFNGLTFNNQGTALSLRPFGDTGNSRIEEYLTQADPLDSIIINAGIWDMQDFAPSGISVDEYANNLSLIFDVIDTANVPVYWATTTPIAPEHPTITLSKHPIYRSAALAEVSLRDYEVIDLYSVVVDDIDQYQISSSNLHFTDEGSAVLGNAVAEAVANVSTTGVPEPNSTVFLLALSVLSVIRRRR